jgi:hypothetical protein
MPNKMHTNRVPTIQLRAKAHERIHFNRIRHWAYFRHEMLFVSWILMEAALIVPIALSLLQWETWSPTVVTIGMMAGIMLPFYLARLMTWLKLPLRFQQRIMVGTALFTILWMVRSINYDAASLFDFSFIGQFFTNLTVANSNQWQHDLGLFALISLAWWRSIVLVTRTIDVVRFGQRFRRSSLYLLPFIILLAYVRLDWSILPFIMLFFLAGLTAVSLTRAEQAELEQKAIIASISPRWFSRVVMIGLLITLIANWSSRLISGSFSQMSGFLTPIWQAFRYSLTTTGLTITYLTSPLFGVFDAIFNRIIALWQWILSRLFVPVDNPTEGSSSENFTEQMQQYLLEQQGQESEWIINWRVILLILLIVLLTIAVYTLGRTYNKNKVTLQNGRFGRMIDTFVSQLSRGNRPKQKKSKEEPFDWKTAVTIQRIYEQMTIIAAKLGHPREQFQTPYEYLPILHHLWPEHQVDVQKITTAYIKIRYGELPENKEELLQIKQAWKRIETVSAENLQKNKATK